VGCQDRRRLPLRARNPEVHARPGRRELIGRRPIRLGERPLRLTIWSSRLLGTEGTPPRARASTTGLLVFGLLLPYAGFVPAASRSCPRFPSRLLDGRRGSTVRVR
jgi:hypothetical protein